MSDVIVRAAIGAHGFAVHIGAGLVARIGEVFPADAGSALVVGRQAERKYLVSGHAGATIDKQAAAGGKVATGTVLYWSNGLPVIAIEGDQIGARFGRMNVKRNRVTNVEALNKAVETWVRDMPEPVDRVVVDPPRGGLSKDVRYALLLRRPARITYVSCHPAALARDLHELADSYRIEHLAFLDLFPQTGHMEVLVQLVAKAALG